MTALPSLWNGTLRLEALQVPVALAATRAGGDVSLRTLHRPCSHPLAQQLECPVHGQVPADELVSGWEVAPGEFITVEKDELDELNGSGDRSIEVLQVFTGDELDETLVRSSYWLMPTGGDFARRGYAIVATGLGVKHALLVRLTYRTEKIAAVRAVGNGALVLHVLAAADDAVPSTAIVDELQAVTVSNREARLARQLIRGKLQPLDAAAIVNPPRMRLRALLESKLAAGVDKVAPDPTLSASTTAPGLAPADLEDALRRSVEALQENAA